MSSIIIMLITIITTTIVNIVICLRQIERIKKTTDSLIRFNDEQAKLNNLIIKYIIDKEEKEKNKNKVILPIIMGEA